MVRPYPLLLFALSFSVVCGAALSFTVVYVGAAFPLNVQGVCVASILTKAMLYCMGQLEWLIQFIKRKYLMKAIVVVLVVLLLQLGQCKKAEKEGESLVHWGIKVGFWLLLGVTLGVYFQARLKLKDLSKGLMEVLLYALFIAVAVYTMFSVEQLVSEYF